MLVSEQFFVLFVPSKLSWGIKIALLCLIRAKNSCADLSYNVTCQQIMILYFQNLYSNLSLLQKDGKIEPAPLFFS